MIVTEMLQGSPLILERTPHLYEASLCMLGPDIIEHAQTHHEGREIYMQLARKAVDQALLVCIPFIKFNTL